MGYIYSIVYASDFYPIAQDGSNDFAEEKEAFLRLNQMENQDELEIIRCDDNESIDCALPSPNPSMHKPLEAWDWVKIC